MKRVVAALLMALSLCANGPPPLNAWPAAARMQIETAITNAPADSYAVFDADNTIWRHDLEEALLPFLENKGTLSPGTLDPSLKPVPMHPGESLYGYYLRLCEIDDKICYPWIAQVFAGRSLAALKLDVDALMANTAPIPVRFLKDGKTVSGTVSPPAIYPQQRALIAELRARGIRVYVVTAAAEELVRMVVADPRYGLNIAPADVIGVTMLLRDPADGSVSTARKRIAEGHFLDGYYPAARHATMLLTPTLWSPLSWYEGKVAAIQDYIDPVRVPLLVAGDSRSDWAMLFHSGDVRLWVDKNAATTAALHETRKRHAAAEAALKLPVPLGADRNWIEMTPAQLSD
jgi:phosphoserine phosphatase